MTPMSPHHPCPWRRGSEFGPGPRRPLTSDEREIWKARAKGERRAGRLNRAALDVGLALLKRAGTDGRCDPSYATIAADAGCHESTVGRALPALKACGLLRWARRVERREWPEGGPGAQRVEQISNAYELLIPEDAPAPKVSRPRPVRRPDCGTQDASVTPFQYVNKEMKRLLGTLTGLESPRTETPPPAAGAGARPESAKLSIVDAALESLQRAMNETGGDRMP